MGTSQLGNTAFQAHTKKPVNDLCSAVWSKWCVSGSFAQQFWTLPPWKGNNFILLRMYWRSEEIENNFSFKLRIKKKNARPVDFILTLQIGAVTGDLFGSAIAGMYISPAGVGHSWPAASLLFSLGRGGVCTHYTCRVIQCTGQKHHLVLSLC